MKLTNNAQCRSPSLSDDGCWVDFRETRSTQVNRPILFLDRDGTLIEERRYLSDRYMVSLHAGAAEAIAAAHANGWRKPNPGMLVAAIRHYGADVKKSAMIGDQASDILAVTHANIGAAFHVLTGDGTHHAKAAKDALAVLPFGEQCSSIGDPTIVEWIERN